MIGADAEGDEGFKVRQYERMYGEYERRYGKKSASEGEGARGDNGGDAGEGGRRKKGKGGEQRVRGEQKRAGGSHEGMGSDEGPTGATLAAAMQRLDAFDFVGLASRYEDSLTLFKQVVSGYEWHSQRNVTFHTPHLATNYLPNRHP